MLFIRVVGMAKIVVHRDGLDDPSDGFGEPVKKLDGKHGFIDLFWKGVLLVEQRSAGGNLTKAQERPLDYFPGIKEASRIRGTNRGFSCTAPRDHACENAKLVS